MASALTIIQTPKDAVFLRQALLKTNIRAISGSAIYNNYVKMLQYEPDAVLMELAADPRPQLNFLKAVRSNRAVAQKPFVVYGPAFPPNLVEAIIALGASVYLPRPIQADELVTHLQKFCVQERSRTVSNAAPDINQLQKSDFDLLRDKALPLEKKLDIMQAHIGKLLAFPATVAQILKVTQSENSGAGELSAVIQTDPAVSAEMLKVANSVMFTRGNNKRIADIKDAIVRIGFGQTKLIAMSLSVFKMIKDQNFATGFNHADFWFHSVGCALVAEKLARTSRLVDPEEAFIAGLLHDLGILIYNEYFNEIFLKLLERSTAKGVPFLTHERDILGFTHNDLLARLFKDWKFPVSVERLPEQLGNPAMFSEQNVRNAPLAAIVGLAEIITKSLRIGREADCCITPVPNSFMETMKLPYGIQNAFIESLHTDLNMYNQLLKIDSRSFPQTDRSIPDAPRMAILCHSFTGEIFNPIAMWLNTQGYMVSISREANDLPELMRKNHALIASGVSAGIMQAVEDLSDAACAPFDHNAPGPVPVQTGDRRPECRARILIMDNDESVAGASPSPTVLVSRYPVDLRAVDMAVSMLVSEPIIPSELIVDNILRLPANAAITGRANARSLGIALIATNRSEIREKVTAALQGLPVTIEVSNEGPKAVNLAKTSSNEICMTIIDAKIPFLAPADIIRQIRMLPTHKRALYLVIVGNVLLKDQILPLAQLGIRNFVKENSSVGELAEFFRKQIEARLSTD